MSCRTAYAGNSGIASRARTCRAVSRGTDCIRTHRYDALRHRFRMNSPWKDFCCSGTKWTTGSTPVATSSLIWL